MVHGTEFCRDRNLEAEPVAAIHEYPFPLPHYCEIGDLPRVASAAKTNDLLRVTRTIMWYHLPMKLESCRL